MADSFPSAVEQLGQRLPQFLFVVGVYLTHFAVLAEVWIGGFAAFAFLGTFIREVIKDMQDQEGDRELECHTLPVKCGDMASKIFVTALIVLTCALLSYFNFYLLPVPFSWGSFVSRFYLLLMVAFVCELCLLWVAKLPSDYRNAQILMKFLMFMGTMYAICVPKILEAAALS